MLCVLPTILSIVLLGVLPALLNVVLSFTDFDGNYAGFKFVFLDNYINFFTILGTDVSKAFGTTFRYMALMILPLQVIALGAALLVNSQKIKGKGFFRAIFFLPSILGIAVVCTIWQMMYDPIDGLFAMIYEALHKVMPFFPESSAFLGNPKLSLVYISVAALWASFGYSMAIYLAGLAGIGKDYYEAASIEGAGRWALLKHITLPLLWPAVIINLWIALQGTIGMSEYIIFFTNGAYNTSTIGFYIYNMVMKRTASQGQAAAVSIYFFFFTTTVMLLFNKFVRKREVSV